jgi:cell division septation protein DedD
LAQQIQDDGFHEIQLNGKQLVFLFMAATVVSVVIFLCGVLVGRGVRSQIGGTPDTTTLNTASETTPTQPAAPATAPAAGSDPTTAAAPPPAAEDLSYPDRLGKQTAQAEKLKPVDDAKGRAAERTAAPHTPPPAAAKAPAHAVAAPVATPPPTATSGVSEPAGPGFAVQIAALNVRSEADAIAKRLSSKGYAAYVLTPANGTPSVFRVRVGKFPTRREAESVAAKLQKEEQFKPWVTR